MSSNLTPTSLEGTAEWLANGLEHRGGLDPGSSILLPSAAWARLELATIALTGHRTAIVLPSKVNGKPAVLS